MGFNLVHTCSYINRPSKKRPRPASDDEPLDKEMAKEDKKARAAQEREKKKAEAAQEKERKKLQRYVSQLVCIQPLLLSCCPGKF